MERHFNAILSNYTLISNIGVIKFEKRKVLGVARPGEYLFIFQHLSQKRKFLTLYEYEKSSTDWKLDH